MPTDGATFIDKIRARRTYADRPVSDSDHSERSPGDTTAETDISRHETPLQHRADTDTKSAFTTKLAETDGGARKNTGSSGTSAVPNVKFTPICLEKSDEAYDDKESSEEECFQTTIAEALTDSEEDRDKIHTRIDLGDIRSKGSPRNEKPQMKPRYEIPENITDLPCDIFFLNDKTVLQRFETFDELSEYLVNAAVLEKQEPDTQNILNNLIKLPLKNAEHFITMGEYLQRLYEDEHLIDVVLDVQGTTFFAHRVALCCSSNYFAEFFDSTKGHKTPFELKIKGVTAEAFAAFLEFCYTGNITVSPGIAADILILADFLKVNPLREKCDIVAENLPLDQSLKMVVKSKGRSTGKLYHALLKTVVGDFKAASMLEQFLAMDVDLFCRMLESDELVIASEFEVFTIAVRWIVHDLDRRVKHTMRIMGLVRFYYMSQLELFKCVETTSLVRGYDKFREYILIANWLQTADSMDRDDPFKFPRPNPRQCYWKLPVTHINTRTIHQGNDVTLGMPPPLMTSTPNAKFLSPTIQQKKFESVDIFVVGGFIADDKGEEFKFMDRYDVKDNQWLHVSGLPAPRRHHAVAVLDNNIYLIGGSDPYSKEIIPVPTNTVFRMNIGTKKWSKITGMNVYRHSHCACSVRGLIYAIGGKGKFDSVLLSVECYDPLTNEWSFAPSLREPLFGASAAAIGRRIIVTGGIGVNKDVPSDLHVLNTVYSYNTASKCWTKLRDLRFPRCLATLVNMGDTLYLCGGATRSYGVKNSVLYSVSAIDEYDIPGDEWFHVTDMVVPRHDAGAAVAGSRIYMVGGISTPANRVLKSIECYETVTSVWISGVQDLPYPARWICCCSVPSRLHRTK